MLEGNFLNKYIKRKVKRIDNFFIKRKQVVTIEIEQSARVRVNYYYFFFINKKKTSRYKNREC